MDNILRGTMKPDTSQLLERNKLRRNLSQVREPNIQNCFHRFNKILKDVYSPSQLSLLGNKMSIHESRPQKDYEIWEKIHTLTRYMNSRKLKAQQKGDNTDLDVLKTGEESGKARFIHSQNDAKSQPPHAQHPGAAGKDVQMRHCDLKMLDTEKEEEAYRISEFLNYHPLTNSSMNPREFAEFYFVYKKDLEELWAYLTSLGVRIENFTIDHLKQIFYEENQRRLRLAANAQNDLEAKRK